MGDSIDDRRALARTEEEVVGRRRYDRRKDLTWLYAPGDRVLLGWRHAMVICTECSRATDAHDPSCLLGQLATWEVISAHQLGEIGRLRSQVSQGVVELKGERLRRDADVKRAIARAEKAETALRAIKKEMGSSECLSEVRASVTWIVERAFDNTRR